MCPTTVLLLLLTERKQNVHLKEGGGGADWDEAGQLQQLLSTKPLVCQTPERERERDAILEARLSSYVLGRDTDMIPYMMYCRIK